MLRRGGAVIAAIAVATLSSLALSPILHRSPLGLYYIAVIVVARYAGFRASMAAVALSVLCADYVLFPQPVTIAPVSVDNLVAIAILAIIATIISLASLLTRSTRPDGATTPTAR